MFGNINTTIYLPMQLYTIEGGTPVSQTHYFTSASQRVTGPQTELLQLVNTPETQIPQLTDVKMK